MKQTINLPRLLRLTLFALIVTAFALNFTMAWVYLYARTRLKHVFLLRDF